MNVQPNQTSTRASINEYNGSKPNENTFSFMGEARSDYQRFFIDGIKEKMAAYGHVFQPDPNDNVKMVLNIVDRAKPQPYRRKSQGTFVVGVVEFDEMPENVIASGYPYMLYALANLTLLLLPGENGLEAHFLTLEQGHYTVPLVEGQEDAFFEEIYQRIEPLASSQLVINNEYRTDLEESLWNGDQITEQVKVAGRKLDELNLLPSPFPMEDVLTEREMRHVKRLYGIGGLSYGNLSARLDETRFWMSASGVDKGKLEIVGRDILLVSDFDEERPAMVLSVPPEVEPRRVSVDAIEHWMIYQEHPGIGAIIHVHAWMDGIRSTEINYPCGTIELARAVAELVRQEPDPNHAVIGLKNHGITVTGPTMENVLERIENKIIPRVPMS